MGRRAELPQDRARAARRGRHRASCCATWPARTPRSTGSSELIHERTQGNPFFIEEIVRELVETGHLEGERGAYRLVRPVEDTGVPATVQAVLAARIDRLGPTRSSCCRSPRWSARRSAAAALRLTAGLEPRSWSRSLCELIEAGFLYEAELYPERILAFRHPLTREVAYGTQLADRRAATHAAAARAMIELEPDRHDELAALIADHMDAGRRGAGGGALVRPRRLLGRPQPAAGRDAALAAGDRSWSTSSRRTRRRRRWRCTRACSSSTTPGAWGWTAGRGSAGRRGEEIATRTGDLHSLALLKLATAARPGAAAPRRDLDRRRRRGDRASPTSPATSHLRVAIRAPAPTPTSASATSTASKRIARRDARAGRRRPLGRRRDRDRQPARLGADGQGDGAARERDRVRGGRGALRGALEAAAEARRPETASWIRSNQAILVHPQDDAEAALAIARRNCELTERLGDVFSRSLALTNLAWRAS